MIRAAEQMKISAGPGFDLKIIPFPSTFYGGVDVLEQVRRMDLQGAVFVPLRGDDCLQSLQRLETAGFAHVRFGNPLFLGKLKSPLVMGDNRKRMRDTLQYLKQRGHRNIGFLSTHAGSVDEQEYLGQLQGVPHFRPRWLETVEFGGTLEQWRKLSGDRIARGYLDEHPELTAIIVEHSPMVVDLLRQAKAKGRHIPDDLSIVCLDDWGGMESTTPATTAMALSFEKLGKVAVDLLQEVMEGGLPKAEKIVRVPFELIERETVARVVQ